ncbi:MAG: hypothetical protein JO153_08535 [Solirubrobacterales bacterium]|nr:hypothetical protein [Solirubrobacterales bacterium]
MSNGPATTPGPALAGASLYGTDVPGLSPPARQAIKRIAPTLLAALLATVYVIVSPPSFDLAAHLLRAKLFRAEGFGLWNNWWYGGHHTLGYSVLFPPISALLSPQLAAGLAAVGTAAAFEALARRHFGEDAWLGSLWFGAATATNLFTGRLAFAFGLLPAMLAMLALQRRQTLLATALAVLTALASPVAALFAALGGAAAAIGAYSDRRHVASAQPGLAVVAGALLPVALLTLAFPEGGSEPFTFATLWPVLLIAAIALVTLPRAETALRAGALLYSLGCIAAYLVSSPVGSNAARLGALLAGPLAALIWWRRRPVWLLAAALPLIYVQWQAPVRDVSHSANDPSISASYYRPLLAFLERQSGPPFRVEIPFTKFHWETYDVAPDFPLARGWERQLDIKYNPLFYGGALTPGTYRQWLHNLAVRFVAVSDARPDFSAERETQLINGGLPYLRPVLRTQHWRVFAVSAPTPIVAGTATLTRLASDSLTLYVSRPGTSEVRVRFSPYWSIENGSGCVRPSGDFTRVEMRSTGTVRLAISFAPDRIAARSARCT